MLWKRRDEVGERAGEKRGESFGRCNAVLVAGGQVTADSTKDPGAFEGAETAGDLLLYFGHPDVVLALIIRERHTRIR